MIHPELKNSRGRWSPHLAIWSRACPGADDFADHLEQVGDVLFQSFPRGRHCSLLHHPSLLPLQSSWLPRIPSKASCFHTGLVACGKCSADLEKSPTLSSIMVVALWTVSPRLWPQLLMEAFRVPKDLPHSKLGITQSLQCRAKNSLENNSKTFSNFLEIDECFQGLVGPCLPLQHPKFTSPYPATLSQPHYDSSPGKPTSLDALMWPSVIWAPADADREGKSFG